MRNLKLFNTHAEYEVFVKSDKYVEPNVSVSIEENMVNYNIPPVPVSAPGDVVLADASGIYYLANASKLTTDILNQGYSVEGVVIVPSNHTDDGTTRMLSLATMDCTNPTQGNTSSYVSYKWGGNGTDTSLPNLDKVPTTRNDGSTTIGTANYSYLPSDNFSGPQSLVDPLAKYYTYRPEGYIPSPYLSDGEINPDYRFAGTATADLDGKGNTEVLLSLATGQTNWRTAATITNDSDAGYYPAACCCARYETEHTKDWYLPACGELGYLVARFKEISTAVSNVKLLGVNALAMSAGEYFWTSTEYSAGLAPRVNPGNGYMGDSSKSDNNSVRAAASVVVSSRIC